eukprot:1066664-Pyramimonas_sp.AAC.1
MAVVAGSRQRSGCGIEWGRYPSHARRARQARQLLDAAGGAARANTARRTRVRPRRGRGSQINKYRERKGEVAL